MSLNQEGQRYKEKIPCEDGGDRDWSDASISQGKPLIAIKPSEVRERQGKILP